MPIRHRRWDDPALPDDGFRLLVCRFRPRGLPKLGETWDAWWPDLGPSEGLHAAFYGKDESPITLEEYARRYRIEMSMKRTLIAGLGRRLVEGETVTLLCSSACTDPARCHRTLLAELIRDSAAGQASTS